MIYDFYNDDYGTEVNRTKKTVTMDERGGWCRSHSLKFEELAREAEKWDVPLDFSQPDIEVARVATNIILANHAASHGLDPFQYIPRSKKITAPKDRETLARFEALFSLYEAEYILQCLDGKVRDKIRNQ